MSRNLQLCPQPEKEAAPVEDTAETKPVSSRQIIEQLEAIAFADLADVVNLTSDDDGNPKVDIRDMEKMGRQTRAIAEISATKSGFKVRMADKLKAIELLGKHLGMFKGEADHEKTIEVVIPGEMVGREEPPCS